VLEMVKLHLSAIFSSTPQIMSISKMLNDLFLTQPLRKIRILELENLMMNITGAVIKLLHIFNLHGMPV